MGLRVTPPWPGGPSRRPRDVSKYIPPTTAEHDYISFQGRQPTTYGALSPSIRVVATLFSHPRRASAKGCSRDRPARLPPLRHRAAFERVDCPALVQLSATGGRAASRSPCRFEMTLRKLLLKPSARLPFAASRAAHASRLTGLAVVQHPQLLLDGTRLRQRSLHQKYCDQGIASHRSRAAPLPGSSSADPKRSCTPSPTTKRGQQQESDQCQDQRGWWTR